MRFDFATDIGDFVKDIRNSVSDSHLQRAENIFQLLAGGQIATEARELAQRGTHMQRSAAQDIRQTSPGEVTYGGRPYSIGAEYGSHQYHQFEPWDGAYPAPTEGYFFWPAVAHFRDREMDALWDREVFHETFSKAFA